MELGREELLSRLQEMNGHRFEELVADIWEQRGFEANVTKGSGDDGADVIVEKDDPFNPSQKHVIQAKCYSNTSVGKPALLKFGTAIDLWDADAGVFVTTSSYSSPAKDTADRISEKISLVDDEELYRILLEELESPQELLSEYVELDSQSTGENPAVDDATQSDTADNAISKHSSNRSEPMKGGDDNEYSNSSASDTPRNKRVNNAVNSAPSEAGSESLDNEVHIHCPKCDTTTWGDGMEDAFETANTHNKNQHNGKKVTEINREQHSGGGSVSSKSTVSDSDVSADSDSTDANKSSSDTHWRDDEYRDILSDSSTDSEPLAESTSNSSTSTKPSTDTGMKNSNKSVPPEVGSESSEDKVTGNSKYKYSTDSISGSPTSSGKPTGSTTNTSSNSKTTTESATSTPTSSRTSGDTSNNQEHYEYAQESEEYEYSTPSSKSATSAAPTDSALNNTNHPFDEESVAAEPTKDQQYFSQCQVCGESGSIWYVVAADYKTELLKCECCNHLWRKGAQCPVCSSWEADWEEGHPVECDDCGTLWEEVSNLIRKNRWKAKGGPQNGESKTKQQWQNVIED